MKRKIRFKGIPDDSQILGVSRFQKGLHDTQWKINLNLANEERAEIGLSAAPLLKSLSVFNATGKKVDYPHTYVTKIDIEENSKWTNDINPLGLKAGSDSAQRCYSIEAGAKKYYVSAFELARALFLKNPYLARLSVNHNSLAEEFYITQSSNSTEIHSSQFRIISAIGIREAS